MRTERGEENFRDPNGTETDPENHDRPAQEKRHRSRGSKKQGQATKAHKRRCQKNISDKGVRCQLLQGLKPDANPEEHGFRLLQ